MYKILVVVLIFQQCLLCVFCGTGIEGPNYGSDAKQKSYPFIANKAANKTIKTPGNKLNLQIGVPKPPFAINKSTNTTAAIPAGKSPLITNNAEISPANKSIVQETRDGNIPVLAGRKRILHGSKITNTKIAIQPGSQRFVYGSKAKPALISIKARNQPIGTKPILVRNDRYPSVVVAKPSNKISKQAGRKRVLIGSPAIPVVAKTKDVTSLAKGHKRIVHGSVAKFGSFPFLVSLAYKKDNDNFCGGNIIDLNYIITAGHCCGRKDQNNKMILKNPRSIRIIGGDVSITQSASPHRMYRYPVEFIPHPHYDPLTISNDVCLIRLNRPVILSDYTKIIKIGTSTVKANEQCEIAGWGSVDQKSQEKANNLRTGVVNVIDMEWCNGSNSYNGVVAKGTVCASGMNISNPDVEASLDSCQGDSGGPLFCDNQLMGVASWGIGCGRSKFPGIYTDLTQFRMWIDSVVYRQFKMRSCPKDAPLRPKLMIMIIATILNLAKCFRLINFEIGNYIVN